MDSQTIEHIAEFICGDNSEKHPQYRTGSELTRFFERVGLPQFRHDSSTRKWWVVEVLKKLHEYQLFMVLRRLASPFEYGGDKEKVKKALNTLNSILGCEGYEVSIIDGEPSINKFSKNFELDENDNSSERILQPLAPPDFLSLGLEPGIGEILSSRWNEAQICTDNGAVLAAIVIMGSLLEGVLLAVMQRFPKEINTSKCAPTDKDTQKIKQFWNWSLSEMIDCAHDVGWIGLDVKKFSHALRLFRNFIHPYQQMANRFEPDLDTCKISWLVVQAAVTDLTRVLQTIN